jgi:glycosyltransferase involved in cell wall biosynthesis
MAPVAEGAFQGPDGVLLTIAIPTHNRAKYLGLCLGQIARQLPGNEGKVELIVSDNCSSDDTKDVVRSFVERGIAIRYLVNSEDLGADRNFARCYQAATGKYVVIFADDDVFLDGALERVLGVLRGGEYGVVHLNGYGYSNDFQDEAPLQDECRDLIYDDASVFIKKIHCSMTFSSGNIFNKSLTADIDPFEFVGTSLVQLGWILRAIVRAKKNVYIEEFVLAARTHNSGGYELCKVFGGHINGIFDALVREGMDRGYFTCVNRRLVSTFLPSYVLKARRGDIGYSFVRENYFDRLYPVFRKFPSFWLVMVPVISLPVRLAALWFRWAGGAVRMSERALEGISRR